MDLTNTTVADTPGVMMPGPEKYPLASGQLSIVVVGLTLSVVPILLRSYTRAVIMKRWDLSDYSLILSGASIAAFAAIKLVANTYGQGHRKEELSEANLEKALYYANVLRILYNPTMFFSKYSILRHIDETFFNHRRESIGSRSIRVLIWSNLFFYTALLIAFIFACVPREKLWMPDIPGRCINNSAAVVTISALNVLSDLTILVIPLGAVWQLQLPWKTKIGAGAVFSIGIFAVVTGIVRLYYSIQMAKDEDATLSIEIVTVWALGELMAIIDVACFPFFPRLYKHLCRQRENKKAGSKYPNSHGGGATSSSRRAGAPFVQIFDQPEETESMAALRENKPIPEASAQESTVIMMDNLDSRGFQIYRGYNE